MSNQLCACDYGLGNLGKPNCDKVFAAAKKFIFVPQFSNAGVENSVDSTATLNNAWVSALVNNADKSVRFFFSPEVKNVDMPKDAPVMESFEDGSNNFIAEAVRKVTGILPECPPRWKANFERIRCNANTCVYIVDLFGNLVGCQKNNDGKLYPIPLNAKSAYAGVVMAKDGSSQQIGIQFEIPRNFDDSTICMISANAFTDFNMLNIGGLIDANIAFSNIASGAVTATITTPGADLYEAIPVEGLVIADFVSSVTGATSKIRDTTAGADVTITSVTESAPGVYDLVYTLAASKVVVVFADMAGVDFANLKDKSYTTV